jgi:hypothetical protein
MWLLRSPRAFLALSREALEEQNDARRTSLKGNMKLSLFATVDQRVYEERLLKFFKFKIYFSKKKH